MKNFLILLVILILPVKAQTIEKLSGNLFTDSKILFEESRFVQRSSDSVESARSDRTEFWRTGLYETPFGESLPQISLQSENKKSPFLAGLFSFVIPGSGEVYAGNYWKAAIFLVIEAAVITTVPSEANPFNLRSGPIPSNTKLSPESVQTLN